MGTLGIVLGSVAVILAIIGTLAFTEQAPFEPIKESIASKENLDKTEPIVTDIKTKSEGVTKMIIPANNEKVTKLENRISELEERVTTLQNEISVLYGEEPTPVRTNEIVLPQIDIRQHYCDLRFNCVDPYIIEVPVGETVTWKNEFEQKLTVVQATNYENNGCGSTSSFISLEISPNQIATKQFNKAGEYIYCVNGYSNSNDIHGIIIVSEAKDII